MSTDAISPLRQRMIEDMAARKLGRHAQRSHIHSYRRFAAFFGRSPDTATTEDEGLAGQGRDRGDPAGGPARMRSVGSVSIAGAAPVGEHHRLERNPTISAIRIACPGGRRCRSAAGATLNRPGTPSRPLPPAAGKGVGKR